jgi:Polysaccharide pyruvyl transferase
MTPRATASGRPDPHHDAVRRAKSSRILRSSWPRTTESPRRAAKVRNDALGPRSCSLAFHFSKPESSSTRGLWKSRKCRLGLHQRDQIKVNLFLANDTSSSDHAGCKAVMRSLRKVLTELPQINIVGSSNHNHLAVNEAEFSAADVLFVNGEGTIHHSGVRARFLLNLIAKAKRTGKRVVLANALFQQYEWPDVRILGGLSLLAVREPRSAAFARTFGGNPELFLDSAADPLFLTQGVAEPLSDGCVIGGFHAKGLLYDPFAEIKGQRLTMRRRNFEDIVTTLRSAEVYLTAQHHGVYAAALAGCPFVATPSNSHKIDSFIEWTGLPIPICMSIEEIPSAIAFAIRNRAMYAELPDFLRERSVLTSSRVLEALS